jgi:DNA replication protein DnaC
MSPTDELVPVLKTLRLSGVMQSLELRLREAAEENLSHVEFLLRLLGDEVQRRAAKQTSLRLRRANFEHAKTLEEFDFAFNSELPRSRLLDLATCRFVAQREAVILVGPTGVGKSHIAQALGHRACLAGHTVLFETAHRLFAELRAARADGTLERRLARYQAVDLLIVDDLGLRPLRDPEPFDLYELIRGRHEKGALVISSARGPGHVRAGHPVLEAGTGLPEAVDGH